MKYQLLTAAAILSCVVACSPDRAAPHPANRFDGNVSVDPTTFQTYSSYNGYRRARVPAVQFTTTRGIRCRFGPSYPDPDQGVHCWGPLSGAENSANFAMASVSPYDTETKDIVVPWTPVAPDRVAFSFLSHVDDLDAFETYLDEGLTKHPVDPNSYHLLERGQMITLAGQLGTSAATSICAVATDDTITCEIRPASDGKTHGLELSPEGSRTY